MLLTARLPIFIRPLSLASVRNDILMYNLQAHPKAEVAYVMKRNKWAFWHEAYGVLFYSPAVCFHRLWLIDLSFRLFQSHFYLSCPFKMCLFRTGWLLGLLHTQHCTSLGPEQYTCHEVVGSPEYTHHLQFMASLKSKPRSVSVELGLEMLLF